MTTSLHSKVAVVTGGTAGIGKAIAEDLIKAFATVIIIGSNREKGIKALHELQTKEPSAKVDFKAVDVSDFAAVQEMVSEIIEQHQKIDLLVNNAGITRDNLMLKATEEEWDLVMNTNLKSCFNLCKAASKPMLKARCGHIINISSVVGIMGNAGQCNYAASKAGMIGLTKSLAKEFAARGIYVNCIAPGFVETDMTDKLSASQKEAAISTIPLKKFGQPSDIAAAALFLATSNYITGQTIVIDGGISM